MSGEENINNFDALWKSRIITKYKLEHFIKEFDKEIKPTDLKTLMKSNKFNISKYIFNNAFLRNKLKEVKLEYFENIQTPVKSVNLSKLGLSKNLTEEEKDNFENPNFNIGDPFIGNIPLGDYLTKDGKERQKVVLQKHQQKFLEGFFYGNLKGGIIFHGVGTGKTYTAVASINFYMMLYPKNKIVFITPTAVIFNMIKALLDYGVDVRNPKIKYFTYDNFLRTKIDLTDTLVIIDEAHNYRSFAGTAEVKDFDGNIKVALIGSKKAGDAMMKLMKAHKCLCLTGTPFVNTPYDIENLLAMAEGRMSNNAETFYNISSRKDLRYDYFKFRISHYENNRNDDNFPERREKYIAIGLNREKYGKIISSITSEIELDKYFKPNTKNKNAFYVRSRQNASVVEDLKTDYVLKDIKDNPKKKFVIYSSFINFGIDQLTKGLKKINVKYVMITGKETAKEKENSKDSYNKWDYSNKNTFEEYARVMIISKAGAEGVDLIATNTIYILDPVWNEATYEQIVARAIRYKSHEKLPKNERFVNVKRLFLVFDDEVAYFADINNGNFDFEKMKEKFLLVKAMKENEKEQQEIKINIASINKDTKKSKEKSKLTRNINLEKKKKRNNGKI
jgi:hypothetical protein